MTFNIARKPLPAALVDFATQAGVSIATSAASRCEPPSQVLIGRFTVEEGLARLLSGTGCAFRKIDDQAFEIVRRPAPALAQPRPPPRDADVTELVVVATRRPTPAAQLAYPLTVADATDLTAQGLHDTADLAQLAPSMTVTNLGSGRDKILIRGLSDGPLTGRTQSMVGLYLDDVRLTYNAPDPDLRLVDMAQAEVLRGPQGALYGAGSLGGVLHLVTQAPDPSGRYGWVSGTYGTTQGGEGSSALEGMANTPILGGRGAMRGVAYREVEGGYIDDPALGLRDVNRVIRTGGRFAVTFDLGASWTLSAGLTGQSINADDTQYALGGQPPYTRRNQLREPHDNDFGEAHLGLRGQLGGLETRWTTALVSHQLVSRYDASAAPPVPTPSGPVAYDDDDAIQSLVSEATIAAPAGSRLQWIAGAFYAWTTQDIRLRLTALGAAPIVAFQEDRHDRLQEGALFGEVTAPIGSAISLTLGGRVFASDTQVSSQTQAPLGALTARFSGGVSHAGFAPKVVLSYRPTDHSLFYLQAAEGYRPGGVNTTGAPGQAFGGPGGAEPYRYYQSDELWSFEAGTRLSLLEDRLTIRAAAFEAFWKNIQSDELLPSGLPFTANIGDGRNQGLEAEARYATGALVLQGQILLNAPELDHANPAFPARPDLGLAGVPSVSFGASAHYAWPLPRGRAVELDGRYAYVGPSRLTFDAAISPKMGDYSTGRIAATLADPRWRLTVAVDNPANTRGDTFAYGNPFILRSTRQMTPLRPRTTSITLRLAF